MRNFLALLGWSPGNDVEVMTEAQMVELFSPDGLLKKAAVFDPKKLEWMNGQHLTLVPLAELAPRVTKALEAAGLATAEQLAAREEWYLALLDLLRVRARTIDDVVRQATPYLRETIEYDPDAVAKQWKDAPAAADLLGDVRVTLASLERWDVTGMEEALRALAERRGVPAGKLLQPLRVALTGLTVSPGIFDVLLMLGRDRSLARLAAAVDYLAAGTNS
jgi:glutamyl-tRNA synthetase